MSNRSFVGLLVVGTITAAPLIAAAWLMVVATVNFHDALHLSVFVAVLTHLHLARRDRRADHRAARQAARAAYAAATRPAPGPAWDDEPDLNAWADRPTVGDFARAAA